MPEHPSPAERREWATSLLEGTTPARWSVEPPRDYDGTHHLWISTEDKQPEHPWSVRAICWLTGSMGDSDIIASRGEKAVRRDDRVDADARLIAAAPDLAAAVRDLADENERLRGDVRALTHQQAAAESASLGWQGLAADALTEEPQP